MVNCYEEDVGVLAAQMAPPPAHVAVSKQQGGGVVVRFVTWNINVLMGADSHSSVDPSSVMAVLESLNADVLVLQECPSVWKDASWESDFAQRGRGDELQRIRQLDAMLRCSGYQLFRSPADNPTLLATRLPVSASENGPRLERVPVKFVSQYGGGEVWVEERGARYAELSLPGSPPIAVYATHLHHMDNCADAGEGVRKREALRLLEHFQSQRVKPPVAVLLADFNQPRSSDYDARDWEVIAAGRRRVGEPEDDGVAALLSASGFSCVFDPAPAAHNFGRRNLPPFTHWTGTTVDYAYVCTSGAIKAEVLGTYVSYTALSDHLPLVVDLRIEAA